MLIVADTSPLNYLVLIDAVHILPDLYGQIVIPPDVLAELRHTTGPQAVRAWAASPPRWLDVRKPRLVVDTSLPLDAGERAAIALAQELAADRLLIDERDGRKMAVRLGIPIAGTLAVLRDAALSGLLDLESALQRLKQTLSSIAQTPYPDTRRRSQGRGLGRRLTLPRDNIEHRDARPCPRMPMLVRNSISS